MINETKLIDAGEGRPTIWFLKGLPASGKSTWTMANGENLNAVRINKDSLRDMMGLPYSKDTERVVVHTSREMGKAALRAGKNVIVDDTNFASKHLNAWKSIAEEKSINANLIEVHFDIPIKECIKRDANRVNSIGEVRILQMWENMTGGCIDDKRAYAEQDETLPKAIIVDIDGTLSLATGRNIYDDSMIHTDRVNEPVKWLISQIFWNAGTFQVGPPYDKIEEIKIIFLTGRAGSDICHEETMKWLKKHSGVRDFTLFMRPEGDDRKDSIVKTEIFNEQIKDNYNVIFALDDRDSVVNMWRKDLKIPCFQVWYGDF